MQPSVIVLGQIKMNAISKTPNLSPYFKATVAVVSNGGNQAAVIGGKAAKKKIVTPTPIYKVLGYSLNQELLSGRTCISSGVAGLSLRNLLIY